MAPQSFNNFRPHALASRSAASRCGWVDLTDAERQLNMEWTAGMMWRVGPLSLEWFLAPIPNLGLDPGQIESAVEHAFAMWQGVTPVNFPRQLQAGNARLIVSWTPIDGQTGVLAKTLTGRTMQFDDGERWSMTNPPAASATADVLTIALHEVGHAIGIGDIPSEPTAIMHGFFGSGCAVIRHGFTPADHRAIAARFGT
jgi:hypothetical protein